MDGKINIDDLLTHQLSLEGNRGFDLMHAGEYSICRGLLVTDKRLRITGSRSCVSPSLMQIDPFAIRITTYGIMSGTLICCLSCWQIWARAITLSARFLWNAPCIAPTAHRRRATGETEFVNSVAAMSASGQYGPAKSVRVLSGLLTCPWAPTSVPY